ncbi:MAG: cupin-like domain-containing protein [bacterium]
MTPIFTDWKSHDTDDFKDGILVTRHSLHRSPLFSDESLRELLGKHPASLSMVYAMPSRQGSEKSFREGDFGKRSPEEIFQAIERGQLWVQLLQLNKSHEEFAQLEQQIIGEMKQQIPGFRPSRCKLSLLISSPGINVSYHADIPRNALWHLRGQKRVYIYPPTEEFISHEALENICLGTTQESLPYRPEFDDSAYVVEMQPGDVATWPVNAPHRVENLDTLNVSLVMEYFEPHALLKYGVYLTNGLLRNRLNAPPRSHRYDTPIAAVKLGAATAIKALKLHKPSKRPRYLSFAVDPNAPQGLTDIQPKLREN